MKANIAVFFATIFIVALSAFVGGITSSSITRNIDNANKAWGELTRQHENRLVIANNIANLPVAEKTLLGFSAQIQSAVVAIGMMRAPLSDGVEALGDKPRTVAWKLDYSLVTPELLREFDAAWSKLSDLLQRTMLTANDSELGRDKDFVALRARYQENAASIANARRTLISEVETVNNQVCCGWPARFIAERREIKPLTYVSYER